MESGKRKYQGTGEDADRDKQRKFQATPSIYGRPAGTTGKLTPYAIRFGASDDELFNHEFASTDPPEPRPVQSGLTPKDFPVDKSPLTPVTNERATELLDYQRTELWGWSALEMVDLEIIEATVKPSNLSNEIHPIFDKSRWHMPTGETGSVEYYLADGSQLDINKRGVWNCLAPSLKLASQFLANLQVFEWWDAVWEGRREQFPHPDGPPNPNLVRFFKRSEQERLENPVKLEKYLHDINWEVGIAGKESTTDWEARTCVPFTSPGLPLITISGKLIEPLLRTGDEQLTTAQRLTQDFYLATTVLHELAHAVGYIWFDANPVLPEIGSIKKDPPTVGTRYDKTPAGVYEIIKEETHEGEETEQEAHRAFRRKWAGFNFRKKSKETLDELLMSKEYWNAIRRLREEDWFAPTGSNIYNTIKKHYPPGLVTEQYITHDLEKNLLNPDGAASDDLSGDDFITAITKLRLEGFFAKPRKLEHYYMDEDVSEYGFSMTASILGGQLGHNPAVPRDYLHRKSIKEAWSGFALDSPDIIKPLEGDPMPFYNILISDFPLYRKGCENLYNVGGSPILAPEKFDDPKYREMKWPIHLSYIEEIQQDGFWEISCSKYGGEMVKVFPKILGRLSNTDEVEINQSILDLIMEANPLGEGWIENKHKVNCRRIVDRVVARQKQNERQTKAIDLARTNPQKQAQLHTYLVGRKSARIAFYGNLAAELKREKALEEAMKKFAL